MTPPTESMPVPEFSEDEIRRYRIIFSGIVQGVGFRVEMWQIAKKLGLTGFVENLPNGDVWAQLQGPENKIRYVIDYMKSIPRIHIENMEMIEIDKNEETEFEALY